MITNKAIALSMTKQYAGIAQDNIDWDITLEQMLNESRSYKLNAIDGTQELESYRIFIVAALQIWSHTSTARSQLTSADGATWLVPKQIAESLNGLLSLQKAFDAGLSNIPVGWATEDKRRLLCGCDAINQTIFSIGYGVATTV